MKLLIKHKEIMGSYLSIFSNVQPTTYMVQNTCYGCSQPMYHQLRSPNTMEEQYKIIRKSLCHECFKKMRTSFNTTDPNELKLAILSCMCFFEDMNFMEVAEIFRTTWRTVEVIPRKMLSSFEVSHNVCCITSLGSTATNINIFLDTRNNSLYVIE